MTKFAFLFSCFNFLLYRYETSTYADVTDSINSQLRIDYSPEGGIWLPPHYSKSDPGVNETLLKSLYCDERYLCTPSSKFFPPGSIDSSNVLSAALTWQTTKPPLQLHNNITACEALVKKGIKKILFSGDSYMRQIYAATLITLNGDYKHGSIDPNNQQAISYCQYHRQFFEKKCGTHSLIHYAQVCDGRIILDPILHSLPTAHDLHSHCFTRGNSAKDKEKDGTVLLWSFGNYNVINGRYANAGPNRRGVNNATEYQKLFESDICPANRNNEFSNHCSLWWVSTHYRLRAHFPDDENADMVRSFNEGMREYFQTLHRQPASQSMCNQVNYVDVYNMTAQLALNHSDVAPQLTYDNVHWGMEVNLIKAQILINALTSS